MIAHCQGISQDTVGAIRQIACSQRSVLGRHMYVTPGCRMYARMVLPASGLHRGAGRRRAKAYGFGRLLAGLHVSFGAHRIVHVRAQHAETLLVEQDPTMTSIADPDFRFGPGILRHCNLLPRDWDCNAHAAPERSSWDDHGRKSGKIVTVRPNGSTSIRALISSSSVLPCSARVSGCAHRARTTDAGCTRLLIRAGSVRPERSGRCIALSDPVCCRRRSQHARYAAGVGPAAHLARARCPCGHGWLAAV